MNIKRVGRKIKTNRKKERKKERNPQNKKIERGYSKMKKKTFIHILTISITLRQIYVVS